MEITKHFLVESMPTGEIRVSAELFPEETKHAAVMRGFSTTEARVFAAQLIDAAKAVEDAE
ncbi:hypothetical protein [Kitasatospora mediocidica]|uniref:hypothetical protein n=1 Tax=Kitasatospora mediocidica TaxID=58352 RepID=UPI000560EF12|nr:hypothetical protein [Kitasatospora mediocidica]